MLKVGLLGAGRIAGVHATAITTNPGSTRTWRPQHRQGIVDAWVAIDDDLAHGPQPERTSDSP